MSSIVARQLGQLLVENSVIKPAELDSHLERADAAGVSFVKYLVDAGQVQEADVMRVVADRLNMPFLDLGPEHRDPTRPVLSYLPAEAALAHEAVPIEIDKAGRLVVAVPDPFNTDKAIALATAAGIEVVLAMAARSAIRDALAAAYGVERPTGEDTMDEADLEEVMAGSQQVELNELLEKLIDLKGSDLHITAGSSPLARINGELTPLSGYPPLTPNVVQAMIFDILSTRQRKALEEEKELDGSHPLVGRSRFRFSVYIQRGSYGAVFRAIPSQIPALGDLGMPKILATFAQLPRGLVLVTGPTGSGKSTTLAALIDLVNSTRRVHVMTVEDPIEVTHKHKLAIVNQREVGSDTHGFAVALRHVLRQDPDVVLIGEMRDLETISTAITAAETGHLVFATLHTNDAPQSIDRIIDVFPPHQQQQVRVQLASSLQAVVSQQLLPLTSGDGRVSAVEVMIATAAIRNYIREGKVHQIPSAIQAGAKHGMQTMDQALASLVQNAKVDYAVAAERARDREQFDILMGGRR